MKTPREILLQRHCEAESKLDAIRESALEEITHAKTQSREENVSVSWAFLAALRDTFFSFRCHIAGMSAVWLFIIFLKIDFSSASNERVAPVAQNSASSPQRVVTALLENRRQIAELTASSANGNPPPVQPTPQSFVPPRRSEFSYPTEIA